MISIQTIRINKPSILECLTARRTPDNQIKPYHITLTISVSMQYETFEIHFFDENELRHYSNIFAGGLSKQGNRQKLTLENAVLPRAGSEIIYSALKKNADLAELEVDDEFFTKQQKTKIEKLIAQRLKKYKSKAKTKEKKAIQTKEFTFKNYTTNRLLYGLVGGIASLSMYTFFSSVAFLPMIAFMALGGVVGVFFAFARESYINQIGEDYNTNKKIAAIKNAGEQEALKMGLAAKDYPGFFWSFRKLAANRHPYAFNAGMKIAVENNKSLITAIKKLRVK